MIRMIRMRRKQLLAFTDMLVIGMLVMGILVTGKLVRGMLVIGKHSTVLHFA